ncbi:hypothetical protein D3C73_1613140 [compost metagenome]
MIRAHRKCVASAADDKVLEFEFGTDVGAMCGEYELDVLLLLERLNGLHLRLRMEVGFQFLDQSQSHPSPVALVKV